MVVIEDILKDILAWEDWSIIIPILVITQAILSLFVFFVIVAVWKRLINIETLMRKGGHPYYSYPETEETPQPASSEVEEKYPDVEKEEEIEPETKKILDEMGWRKGVGVQRDKDQENE